MARVHPFLVGATALFVGVTALGASAISERRARRARRPPPPPAEPEAPLPAPPRRPSYQPPRAYHAPPATTTEPLLAALRVRVTGPHGVIVRDAEVWVAPHGTSEDGERLLLDEDEATGELASTELVPGRYDLLVQAHGLRDVRLADVPTGPKVVEVSLSRAPVLLGAVGNGGACGGIAIVVEGPDGEGGGVTVDPDTCRFEIEELPDEGPLTVLAQGPGWKEQALVTLPADGDPRPLCVRPPCATTPAALAIYVVDAAGRLAPAVSLDWSRETETEGELGSTTVDGLSLMHGRVAGQVLRLHASAGARRVETSVSVGEGVSEVVLTLPVATDEDGDSAEADDEHGGGGEDLVVRTLGRKSHVHRAYQEAELPILIH